MTHYSNLRKVSFWLLPGNIDFSKVVSNKVAQSSFNPPSLRNALGGLCYYFRDSAWETKTYKEKKSDNARFLLFFGKLHCRKDHQKTFLDFADNFPDADVIYSDFLASKKFCFFRLLKSIPLFLIWFIQMILKGVSVFEALNVIRYIQMSYYTLHEISNAFARPYSFVVVYYDTCPDENFTVQVFKNKGIKTMTLQHGIFAKKSTIKTISDTAFELSESISDYFLAWNDYTKDEAIKAGLAPNKIVVLGAPKYINTRKPDRPTIGDSDVFGVILNNSAFDIHNRALIDMANKIHMATGKKYVLRYHPSMLQSKD